MAPIIVLLELPARLLDRDIHPSLPFGGFEWSLGGDLATRTAALAESLAQTVTAAEGAGRVGVALLVDRAQVLSDEQGPRRRPSTLSTLLAAVSALQRQGLPLALVLCGPPTLTINLLDARTCSERLFRCDEAAHPRFTVPVS